MISCQEVSCQCLVLGRFINPLLNLSELLSTPPDKALPQFLGKRVGKITRSGTLNQRLLD